MPDAGATNRTDLIERPVDSRNPDALRKGLVDARTFLKPESITPDILSPAIFPPTNEEQPPGYHQDRAQQAHENGTAKEIARADHNHDLTYLRQEEVRDKGDDDPDYIDPISNVVDAIAAPGELHYRRIVMWAFDPDRPVPSTPVYVYAAFTKDTGATWSAYRLVGVVPPGIDSLVYSADPWYDFTSATTYAKYVIRLPRNDRSAKLRIPRSGDDGKLHLGYLPTDKLGYRGWKQPARLATSAALPANTRTGNVLTESANGALTLDGVAAAAGNRVLVKDEATGAHNGLYLVTSAGSAGSPFILTRAADCDEDADVAGGLVVMVTEGATLADSAWSLTTNDPITVNTTVLGFARVGITSHGALSGLAGDDHAQYALLAGRAGGQSLKGGTAASEVLELYGTAHATPGTVRIKASGIEVPVRGITFASSPYTVAPDDHLLLVDTSGGNVIVNLPDVATCRGRVLHVKKLEAANTLTLDASGAQTIDGALTLAWTTRYQAYSIIAPDAGTDWAVI